MDRKLYTVFLYPLTAPDLPEVKEYLCSRLYATALCFTTPHHGGKLAVLATFESDRAFLDFTNRIKQVHPDIQWIVRDKMPDMQAMMDGFLPED